MTSGALLHLLSPAIKATLADHAGKITAWDSGVGSTMVAMSQAAVAGLAYIFRVSVSLTRPLPHNASLHG